MALVLKDRVLETCTSPGTGTVTLLGAVTGYQAFSVVGNGNTCYYAIADQNGANWECGIGTYSSAGNTLARTTVLSSSNAGSLTNFSSGTQNVFLTYPSERSVNLSSAALTSGRVTYATTDGLLTDSANFTYGTGLTVNGLSQVYQTGLYTVDGTLSNYSATNGFYLNGNATGWLTLRGDGTGTNYIQINGSSYGEPNLQRFFTASTERMRITAAGNIGIGAGSPTQKLTVVDATVSATVSASFANSNNGVYIRNSGSTTSYVGDSTGANNSIAFDTSNYVAILTNGGTERMRITSAGLVGIRTSSPSAVLDVSPSGTVAGLPAARFTSNAGGGSVANLVGLAVYWNLSNGFAETTLAYGNTVNSFLAIGSHNGTSYTERMRIDASGNLGIGTTSPTGRLDVVYDNALVGRFYSSAGRGIVRVDGLTDSSFQSYKNGSLVGFFQSDSGGTEIVTGTSGAFPYSIYTNNTEKVRVTSAGNVGIGTSSFPSDAKLSISNAGAIGIEFSVNNAIANENRLFSYNRSANVWVPMNYDASTHQFLIGGSEKMRITSTGNLAIGTTGSLTGSSRKAVTINCAAGELSILELGVNGTVAAYLYTNASQTTLNSQGASPLTFETNGSERMRIDTSGNLGIGTTSPANKLQVSGSIYIVESTSNFLKFSSDGYKYLVSSTNAGDYLSMACNPASLGMQFGKSTVSAPATFVPLMTIRVSGNVGIGTDGPATKLQVYGGALTVNDEATYAARFGNNSNKGVTIGYDTTNNVGHIGSINPAVAWTSLVINANEGNLGLGVTPSAWTTANNVRALQMKAGSFWSFSTSALAMSQNSYYNGTNYIYSNTAQATQYIQITGEHQWFNAASGTAGNAITFTQAMTLDASGNLLVGTTTAVGKFCVTFNGAAENGTVYRLTANSSGAGYVYYQDNATNTCGSVVRVGTTSAVVYNSTSDYRLKTVIGAVTGQGERIDALKPIDYQWKESNQQSRGFLAHEFQTVYPNSVSGEKDAINANGKPVYQGMQASTAEVIADLVAEIQSLRQRIATLENK